MRNEIREEISSHWRQEGTAGHLGRFYCFGMQCHIFWWATLLGHLQFAARVDMRLGVSFFGEFLEY